MLEYEKLDVLISDFRKLEESRKDYIRELVRKLADIHCGKGYMGTIFQEGCYICRRALNANNFIGD